MLMTKLKFKVTRVTDQQEVTEEISVVADGCTYFFNAQHLYLQLTAIERSYFDYMCEHMDFANRINISNVTRKDYSNFYNKITTSNDGPPAKVLQVMEKKLKSLKLLIGVKGQRSAHYVNPKYVSKGTASQRKKTLQILSGIAQEGLIDLSTIINIPLDSIQKQLPQKA